MVHNRIRSFALCALIAPASFAAGDLTPERAVALALEKNAGVAAASARVAAAEGLRTQAGLKPNPRFILQSENARISGAPPFRYSQDTDNFAYVTQILEAGGKRRSRIELASQNVRLNELSAGPNALSSPLEFSLRTGWRPARNVWQPCLRTVSACSTGRIAYRKQT